MSIQPIVDEVIRTGWLKLSQEAALLRAVGRGSGLSAAELKALIRLQSSLKSGEILMAEQKQCVNAMEELVRDAILEDLGRRNLDESSLPDLGDVAAYALNRLPALYATTREGFEAQVSRAREELGPTIREKAAEAVELALARPDPRPGSEALGRAKGDDSLTRLFARLAQDMPMVA